MSASRIIQMKAFLRRVVWNRPRHNFWHGAELRIVLVAVTSGLVAFALGWLL